MSEFKLIVAGGREFNGHATMARVLHQLAEKVDGEVSIVSGMARGADRLAYQFAKEMNVKVYEFPADWDTFGKSAGYKRNQQMAEFADGLLAFWDGKSRGTKHMIDIAQRLGLFVQIERY